MKNKLTFLKDNLLFSIRRRPAAFVLSVFCVIAMTLSAGFFLRMVKSDDEFVDSQSIKMLDIDTKTVAGVLSELIESDYVGNSRYTDKNASVNWAMNFADKRRRGQSGNLHLVFSEKQGVFEREEIENGAYVVAASDSFLRINNVKVGDTVEFYGSEYLIRRVIYGNSSTDDVFLKIPYTALPSEFFFDFAKDEELTGGSSFDKNETTEILSFFRWRIGVFGLSEEFYTEGAKPLNALGFEIGPSSETVSGSVWVYAGLITAFFIISCVCMRLIFGYYFKADAFKYAAYKTLGASNATVTAAMFVEAGAVFIAGTAIGAVLEFSVKKYLLLSDIPDWGWHIPILIFINLLLCVTAVLPDAVKRAKLSPADTEAL